MKFVKMNHIKNVLVIKYVLQKANGNVAVSHFIPSLFFAGKARAYKGGLNGVTVITHLICIRLAREY